MTDTKPAMPELPEPMPNYPEPGEATFTADQMSAYGATCAAGAAPGAAQEQAEPINAELLDALAPFVLANSSDEFVTLVVRSGDITKARAAIARAAAMGWGVAVLPAASEARNFREAEFTPTLFYVGSDGRDIPGSDTAAIIEDCKGALLVAVDAAVSHGFEHGKFCYIAIERLSELAAAPQPTVAAAEARVPTTNALDALSEARASEIIRASVAKPAGKIPKDRIEFGLNCNMEDPSDDDAAGFYAGVAFAESVLSPSPETTWAHPKRTEAGWREISELEDAAGGVLAAGALVQPEAAPAGDAFEQLVADLWIAACAGPGDDIESRTTRIRELLRANGIGKQLVNANTVAAQMADTPEAQQPAGLWGDVK